ncbi:TnsA-like heteromeric transposase endonuclease subunit [Kitasatospora sp. NPDC028055]|uniref:TnsA-like heteromeric transposase endonuclease subunit n=1 Tax=Kitasatospora sp. NPDC028055 TaxID=3155653 RepID=UPI0034068D6B
MGSSTKAVVRSDSCGLDMLFVAYAGDEAVRDRLRLPEGWQRRWVTSWQVGEGSVAWPVSELGSEPIGSSSPVRRFTWRARQGHRPGLQFMVSTGRHHGFESLEEQRLLLALDFVRVADVLSQPFELDFEHEGGRSRHTPDFLAVLPGGGRWLFDVRPERLIEPLDAVKFAAAREVAEACGWQYSVVAGWRPHAPSVLDFLSSQRRPLRDPMQLQRQLLTSVGRAGEVTFGEAAEATSLPAVARAHAAHLLWHRQLGTDLGRPMGDGSPVWLGSPLRRHP